MLVLSRKTDEVVLVNGNIEVRVIAIKKGRVQLGIDAPKEVSIQRKEVLELGFNALDRIGVSVYGKVG